MSQPCSDASFCARIQVQEVKQFCTTKSNKHCPCLCNKPEETTTVKWQQRVNGKCDIYLSN